MLVPTCIRALRGRFPFDARLRPSENAHHVTDPTQRHRAGIAARHCRRGRPVAL